MRCKVLVLVLVLKKSWLHYYELICHNFLTRFTKKVAKIHQMPQRGHRHGLWYPRLQGLPYVVEMCRNFWQRYAETILVHITKRWRQNTSDLTARPPTSTSNVQARPQTCHINCHRPWSKASWTVEYSTMFTNNHVSSILLYVNKLFTWRQRMGIWQRVRCFWLLFYQLF